VKTVVCRDCGAGIEPGQAKCWLCGAELPASQPTSNTVPLSQVAKVVGAVVFAVGALAIAGGIALFVTCWAAVANIR